MSTIINRRPERSLVSAGRNMDTFLNEFFGNSLKEGENNGAAWLPNADLYENEHAFMIDIDLPGMKKEEVEVSFENGLLQISGERNEEKVDEKPRFHRIERVHGRFKRTFELGTTVKPNQIKARFKEGVLSVEVPKAEEVKPIRIKIS